MISILSNDEDKDKAARRLKVITIRKQSLFLMAIVYFHWSWVVMFVSNITISYNCNDVMVVRILKQYSVITVIVVVRITLIAVPVTVCVELIDVNNARADVTRVTETIAISVRLVPVGDILAVVLGCRNGVKCM